MSGAARGERVAQARPGGRDGQINPSALERRDGPGEPDAYALDTDSATSVEPAIDRLKQLLVEYVNTGAITRIVFMEMAAANGWYYEDRGGVLVAFDDYQRVAAAAVAREADTTGPRRDRIPAIPCASCGAAPVGTFYDGSPRYGCGPHPPITGREQT